MKKIFDFIRKYWKGWESFSVHQRPRTFWKYFTYYPLNWTWTLGSILFIYLFIEGGVRYESPLLWTASLIPFIMLVYNFVDEYYAFQYYKMPDYLKPLEGELNKDFSGNDKYWSRVNNFERDNNIPVTIRHNGVIGRKVSARTLQNIAKWSCTAVMLYMIIRTFITG